MDSSHSQAHADVTVHDFEVTRDDVMQNAGTRPAEQAVHPTRPPKRRALPEGPQSAPTEALVQHGSAEQESEPRQEQYQSCAPSRVQTPRQRSPVRGEPDEGERVLPGLGKRLLTCESWIKKFDQHCDLSGLAGFSDIKKACEEMVGAIRDLNNKIKHGDEALTAHLQQYLHHDKILDARITVLENRALFWEESASTTNEKAEWLHKNWQNHSNLMTTLDGKLKLVDNKATSATRLRGSAKDRGS